MDEWMLNDLLECSVCLERLDTSSKVLPCQHTFCKKCLEDILSTNKELRCPECRVLVDVKIDELPPNVLLMRILEGMRNAAPKKRNSTGGSIRLGAPASSSIPQSIQPSSLPPMMVINQSTPELNARVVGQTAATVKVPNQPYARAVYDYLSKEPGDLSFKKGDLIFLRKKIDNNWYHGECAGNQGVFPLSYVQIITPLPSHIPQCKALYDFRMTNDDEDGCLTFNKGEVLTVIRRVDENWAEGKLNDRIGIFPLAFVEMNNIARALMKLSTNYFGSAQPGPSRLAPPTPTSEDVTPLIPTDHSRSLTQPQSLPPQSIPAQPPVSSTISDSSSSTTLTSPSSSASSTPATSSSSTAPSSPSSPPPQGQPSTAQPLPTKRHSFNVLQHPHNRHSAEILSPTDVAQEPQPQSNGSVENMERVRRSSEIPPPQGSPHSSLQLPASYVALYPYKPQKTDELELKRGSVYTVTERCQDGWFKGTAIRSHKCGVFPGNYVAPAKSLSALQAQVRGLPLTSQKNCPAVPVPLQPRSRTTVSYTRHVPAPGSPRMSNSLGGGTAPALPPRSVSPAAISASWHGENLFRTMESQSQEASSPSHQSPTTTTVNTMSNTAIPLLQSRSADKVKDKKSVSLMRRLTSIKKSRSPPPSYSMDNPVFEDGTSQATPAATNPQPVHVRSGSCPSQLLQMMPLDSSSPHHRMPRAKHKDRPLTPHHARNERSEVAVPITITNSVLPTHRKSNSLDGSDRKTKQLVPPVRERFRCIVPYPPNTEYELELRVGDVIYVHRKREDGWYKGTQQRTGRTGLFPASFVESF